MARRYPPLTDDEYGRAVRRGEERANREPRAIAARYDRKKDMVVVEFASGVVSMFPRSLLQGLQNAEPEQLVAVELTGGGSALRWEPLDADFSVVGLLEGAFGSERWMAELERRGGPIGSPQKTIASRSAGAKGGRPRKTQA